MRIWRPREGDVENPLQYLNKKGFFSINSQAICDADRKFIWYNMDTSGGTHDSHAFKMSEMGLLLKEKGLPSGYWFACDVPFRSHCFYFRCSPLQMLLMLGGCLLRLLLVVVDAFVGTLVVVIAVVLVVDLSVSTFYFLRVRSHAHMQVTMLTHVVSGCCAHTLSRVLGDVPSMTTTTSTSPGAGLMSSALSGCSCNDLEF